MRDENGMLVGWGLGTATFPTIMFQGQARTVPRRDGTGLVELGAQDMGRVPGLRSRRSPNTTCR
jgi:xanthine dehydrogenase YagR molybdenum-binding subunit